MEFKISYFTAAGKVQRLFLLCLWKMLRCQKEQCLLKKHMGFLFPKIMELASDKRLFNALWPFMGLNGEWLG